MYKDLKGLNVLVEHTNYYNKKGLYNILQLMICSLLLLLWLHQVVLT